MTKTALKINDKLKKSCEAAVVSFDKLELDEFNDVRNRLQWCIGSYEFDKNPEGLNDFGKLALQALKAFKEENPRKVTKKVIDALESASKAYDQNTSRSN